MSDGLATDGAGLADGVSGDRGFGARSGLIVPSVGYLPLALNGRPEDREEAELRLAKPVRNESLWTHAVLGAAGRLAAVVAAELSARAHPRDAESGHAGEYRAGLFLRRAAGHDRLPDAPDRRRVCSWWWGHARRRRWRAGATADKGRTEGLG